MWRGELSLQLTLKVIKQKTKVHSPDKENSHNPLLFLSAEETKVKLTYEDKMKMIMVPFHRTQFNNLSFNEQSNSKGLIFKFFHHGSKT